MPWPYAEGDPGPFHNWSPETSANTKKIADLEERLARLENPAVPVNKEVIRRYIWDFINELFEYCPKYQSYLFRDHEGKYVTLQEVTDVLNTVLSQ